MVTQAVLLISGSGQLPSCFFPYLVNLTIVDEILARRHHGTPLVLHLYRQAHFWAHQARPFPIRILVSSFHLVVFGIYGCGSCVRHNTLFPLPSCHYENVFSPTYLGLRHARQSMTPLLLLQLLVSD